MSINFEQDQSHAIEKASDAKDLATQVTKLQELEDLIKAKEQQVKDLKARAENISGEVIPTMMTEMNIKTLKLAAYTPRFNILLSQFLEIKYSINFRNESSDSH